MIQIKETVIQKIIEHAKKDTPVEACGYLAGREGEILKQYPMNNIDKSNEHFSMDPKEQFEVVKKARNEGLDILAVYHSHPDTPARPSAEDIKLAFDPNILYVIVSLASGKPQGIPDIRVFRIHEGVIDTEKLKVI